MTPDDFGRSGGEQPRREPDAASRTAAAAMRNLFVAFVDEGFSESQALYILGVMLSSGNKGDTPT